MEERTRVKKMTGRRMILKETRSHMSSACMIQKKRVEKRNKSSYSHDTWASFVNDGYTEYIEVEIETAVFVQSIEIGENRGMWSIVKIKAWDSDTSHWQQLWSGEADVDQWEWYKNSKQYNKFMPAICQTSFASSIIRIEMDIFSVNDW